MLAAPGTRSPSIASLGAPKGLFEHPERHSAVVAIAAPRPLARGDATALPRGTRLAGVRPAFGAEGWRAPHVTHQLGVERLVGGDRAALPPPGSAWPQRGPPSAPASESTLVIASRRNSPSDTSGQTAVRHAGPAGFPTENPHRSPMRRRALRCSGRRPAAEASQASHILGSAWSPW